MVSRSRDPESGHALLLALFVIVLTLAAGTLIAANIDLRLRLVRQQHHDLQLTALGDAALAMALAELEARPSYSGTGGPVGFADGLIEIRIEDAAYPHAAIAVEVTYAGRRRASRADIRLDPVRVLGWQPVAPVERALPWWR